MTHSRCSLPAAFALASLLVHCSGTTPAHTETANQSENAATASATTGTATPGAEHASSDEIRALVTEALSPQMCPRLTGSYIGLTGPSNATGPAAGVVPAAGRWWIRRCDARVVNDRLQLAMAGPGWIWVDREAMGFRIRQYVLFEADAQLSADVAVGYDRVQRVASIWMNHAQGVGATVLPRGVISATPTGIFAAMIGGVLPLTGASASDRAFAQAGELGSATFRERLATGFTMTMALGSRQIDFMMGPLARGEVPERPFPSDTTQPWQVNQRLMIWPGGLDVVGPIDMTTSPQGLDVELEEGTGATIREICAPRMTAYFDARFRDPSAAVPAPTSAVVIDLAPGTGLRHVLIPATTCPTLLIITPHADAQLPVRMRLRVAPEGSAPDRAAPSAVSIAPAPPLQRVRIQIASISVAAQNADHRDWDVIGGEADPYVITASVPLAREIDRTPVSTDHNNAEWGRWLPGGYDAVRDFPLRFTVSDEDGMNDDLIGTADLEAGALPNAAAEIALPLRTNGAVPIQTGTLRLRIEPAP